MLFFYYGADTKKLREKLHAALAKFKNASVITITDAHSLHDLTAALAGGGMFGSGKRAVVLEHVLNNVEMNDLVLAQLANLQTSGDTFFLVASDLNAATRKQIEKYAEKAEVYDLPKHKKQETIFALANAFQKGKKKDLWIGYQRELSAGKSPESILGVLFWAAKQQLLRAPRDERAKRLVAVLAELPHEARRSGYELEYALERFVLSLAPAPYQNQRE